MSRGIALNLLASALTILAAIALLGSVAMVGDGSLAAPVPAHSESVIRDFYDAVNETFRTGDTALLDAVVAPGLVFHTSPPAMLPGRERLYRHLAVLHAGAPDLRLRIEELTVAGDRVMTRVSTTSDGPGDFLGLRLAAVPVNWGHTDAFRIADNRIAELWSSAPAAVSLEPLRRVDLVTPLPGPLSLSLERLSAPSGEDWELGPYLEPRVISVVAGAMSVVFDTPASPAVFTNDNEHVSPAEVAPGTAVALIGGDAMSLPVGSRYTFRQDHAERGVTAFAVEIPRFSYIGPHQLQERPVNTNGPGQPPGSRAVLTSLADVLLPELPQDATVSFGRAILPPGETITFGEADGPVFIAIESSALVLQVERETTSLELLERGSAGLVMPGAPMSLSNLGETPASAIVVTILPNTALAGAVP